MSSGLLLPAQAHVESTVRPAERIVDAAMDVEGAIPNVSQCIQLTPGLLSGSVVSVAMPSADVYEQRVNRGIEMRFFDEPNAIVAGFLREGGRILINGHLWSSEYVWVGPQVQIELSSLASSRITWLRLSRDRLSGRDRERVEWLQRPFFAERTRFGHVSSLAERVLQGSTYAGHQLERTFLEALRNGDGVPNREPARQARSLQLVRNVEAYMWENVEEPLTLDVICKAVDCGVRALIYAFKDIYGVGPMTYWKVRRLNGAHRKLRSSMGALPILEIAADYGFWHMGHFSADHKQLFGMTPSQAIEAGRLRAAQN